VRDVRNRRIVQAAFVIAGVVVPVWLGLNRLLAMGLLALAWAIALGIERVARR
jgi:hypothetical protein